MCYFLKVSYLNLQKFNVSSFKDDWSENLRVGNLNEIEKILKQVFVES